MALFILLTILVMFQSNAAYPSKSISSELIGTLQEGLFKTLTPYRLFTILMSFGFNVAEVLNNVADYTEDAVISKRYFLENTEIRDIIQMAKALRKLASICGQMLPPIKIIEELLVLIRSKEFKSLKKVLMSNVLEKKIALSSLLPLYTVQTSSKRKTGSNIPCLKRLFEMNKISKYTEQAMYEGLVT